MLIKEYGAWSKTGWGQKYLFVSSTTNSNNNAPTITTSIQYVTQMKIGGGEGRKQYLFVATTSNSNNNTPTTKKKIDYGF